MNHAFKTLVTAFCGLLLASSGASAASLDELQAAAASDPSDFAKVYDGAAAAGGLAGNKTISQEQLKALMLADLDTLRGIFYARYAPAGWKQELYGWDLDAEIQKAKDKVSAADSMTVKEYQRLVKTMLNSAKDYHVEGFFATNEAAIIPLGLTEAEGRYFITYIDHKAFPAGSLPFREGDELTGFDGKSMTAAMAELAASLGMDNVPHSDRGLLAESFFARGAENGYTVPSGPAVLTVRRADGSAVEVPLQWAYFKDWVSPQPFVTAKAAAAAMPLDWSLLMLADQPSADGRGNIAARDGFLPPPGDLIWEASPDSAFRAYIYRAPGGKRVGFVRVPTFQVSDPEKNVAEFAKLVEIFNAGTDALVIDETNNPGGYVFYMYALASMLTDRPLTLPMYRLTMTQNDAMQTAFLLRRAERTTVETDADAQKFLGMTSLVGYPVDLAYFKEKIAHYKDYLASWEAGETLSRPLYLDGLRQVQPHASARYTKPLVVLTNELDISCGDFFPAMLQDNGRAVIFGERTAGAGGSINFVDYPPNLLGINRLRLTATIAVRPNGQPLENLGVTPDLPYRVTADDVQNGYRGYAAALNAAIAGLPRAD